MDRSIIISCSDITAEVVHKWTDDVMSQHNASGLKAMAKSKRGSQQQHKPHNNQSGCRRGDARLERMN